MLADGHSAMTSSLRSCFGEIGVFPLAPSPYYTLLLRASIFCLKRFQRISRDMAGDIEFVKTTTDKGNGKFVSPEAHRSVRSGRDAVGGAANVPKNQLEEEHRK